MERGMFGDRDMFLRRIFGRTGMSEPQNDEPRGVRQRLPFGWDLRRVRGNHTKPCSFCFKDEWRLGRDWYICNALDPWGGDKICTDRACVDAWLVEKGVENPPQWEEDEDESDHDEAESYKRYNFMPKRPLAQPAVQAPLPAAASQPACTPRKLEAAPEGGVGSNRERVEEGDSSSDEQPPPLIPVWAVEETASSFPSQRGRGLKPVAPAGTASQPAHTAIRREVGHASGRMPSPLEPGTSRVPQAGARDHLCIPSPANVEAPVGSQAEKSRSEKPSTSAPRDRSGDQPTPKHKFFCPCSKCQRALAEVGEQNQRTEQAKRKRESRPAESLPGGREVRLLLALEMHKKLCNGRKTS